MTLAILAVGVFMGTASLVFELIYGTSELENLVKRHARFMGNQACSAAAHFLERGDLEGLARHLSQMSADPILESALVADESGRIVAASRFEDRGKMLQDLRVGNLALGKAPSGGGDAWVSLDGKSVLGVYPFLLPPSQSRPLAREQGLLVVEYDLQTPKHKAVAAILLKSGVLLALLALFSLGIWLAVHLLVTRRIRPLMLLARQLTQGAGSTPSALRGSDELAALSEALDKMARDIEARTRQLNEANAAMAREIKEREQVQEALRNSESQFRSVWANSHDAMRLTDENGVIMRVNPAFCELVGGEAPQLLGKNFTDIYNPSHSEVVLDRYKVEFRNRSFTPHKETEVTLLNGRSMVLDATYSLVEFEHQKPFLLTILRDITERKTRESEQLRLERNILEAQRLESLGILAGGVAHDFNNLLTAILGNTGLAKVLLPPDSPAHHNLANVEAASMRAADLCKQMLAYAGRGKLTIQQVRLGSILREMFGLLQVTVGERVRLEIDADQESPPVDADPTQLRQVILSLAINSSEAIGGRPGHLRIRSGLRSFSKEELSKAVQSPVLQPGPYAFFEVEDDGCGMTEDVMARIFDPFFTTKFTGRGLGLPAVLGIVRGHQGALLVRSRAGIGSTFIVALPLSRKPQSAPAPSPGQPEAPPTPGSRILVAEDEETVRSAIVLSLQAAGYDVLTAADGRETLECLEAERGSIDAVLLDLSMPLVGGEELLGAIRKIKPDIRLVLMSGHDLNRLRERLKHFDIAAFLQKPFSPTEAEQALAAALRPEAPSKSLANPARGPQSSDGRDPEKRIAP